MKNRHGDQLPLGQPQLRARPRISKTQLNAIDRGAGNYACEQNAEVNRSTGGNYRDEQGPHTGNSDFTPQISQWQKGTTFASPKTVHPY